MSRNISLDLIRAVAIFLVVLLHANSGQFSRIGDDWWISNAINSLSRVAVPLFIMISGALLIPRLEPLQKHLRRTGRLVLLIVVWSYIYVGWMLLTSSGIGYLWDRPLTSLFDLTLLAWFAHHPMMAHLYFLYSMVMLYLFLPLLQSAYAARHHSHLWYYAAVFFLASVSSTVNAATGISWIWLPDIQMFSTFAGYAMLGALLHSYQPGRRAVIWSGAAYVAATFATFWATSKVSGEVPDEMFATYWSPSVIVASVGAFLVLKSIQPPSWSTARIEALSGLSLGIYFVHMMVLGVIMWSTLSLPIDERLLKVLILAVPTYVVSAAIVYAMKYLKLTRWLVT